MNAHEHISLRDYFAGQALNGLLVSFCDRLEDLNEADTAKAIQHMTALAFATANLMVAASNKILTA